MAAGDVAKAARELQRRHGALLRGEPSFTQTTEQRRAVDALDEARARLRGSERPSAGQLTLDVRAR